MTLYFPTDCKIYHDFLNLFCFAIKYSFSILDHLRWGLLSFVSSSESSSKKIGHEAEIEIYTQSFILCLLVCVYVGVRVGVDMCVCERERERAASREESSFTIHATDIVVHSPLTMTDIKTRERWRESACVCVIVCERERVGGNLLLPPDDYKRRTLCPRMPWFLLSSFFPKKNLMKLMR